MSTVQESVILNSKLKTELIIENFEIMTLEERLELIEITFNNYHKAQVAYMNNVIIKKYNTLE